MLCTHQALANIGIDTVRQIDHVALAVRANLLERVKVLRGENELHHVAGPRAVHVRGEVRHRCLQPVHNLCNNKSVRVCCCVCVNAQRITLKASLLE